MITDDIYTDPDTIQMLYGVPEDETLLVFYAQQVQNNSQLVDPRRPNPTPSGFDPEQTVVVTLEPVSNPGDFTQTFESTQTALQMDQGWSGEN